jgi:hypothetical protein
MHWGRSQEVIWGFGFRQPSWVVDMPRKKKETVDSLKLDFTGQMVAIFDVEGYGPIEIRLDDKETALAVLKTILEYSGNIHDVDSYTAAEGKRLKKLVEGK